MFLFVHDSKFVSGRDWRPVPAGVQANMQVTSGAIVDEACDEDEEEDNPLRHIATFVARPLQADHRVIVLKALEIQTPDPSEHLIPQLGLSDEQVRLRGDDGTLKKGHRVFFKKSDSGREYVRLKDEVRTDVRSRVGSKNVPRSLFKYKDLKDPEEGV